MTDITVFPCPFCGHDDVEIDEIAPKTYAVDCPACGCIGPTSTCTPEDAIAAWNKRATTPAGFRIVETMDPDWVNQIGEID